MSDTVETIYTEDKQRRARIEYDLDGGSCDPREYDELVEVVTPRHHMTEHVDGATFEAQHDALYERGLGGAFGRYLKIFHNVDAYPVYKFEHGNVALSTRDFGDRWDSGMIGWAYIKPGAETWEGMEPHKVIVSYLESLAMWMNGEVYGYIVERRVTGTKTYNDGTPSEEFEEWVDDDEDSCWGILGYEWAEKEAKMALGIKEESNG